MASLTGRPSSTRRAGFSLAATPDGDAAPSTLAVSAGSDGRVSTSSLTEAHTGHVGPPAITGPPDPASLPLGEQQSRDRVAGAVPDGAKPRGRPVRPEIGRSAAGLGRGGAIGLLLGPQAPAAPTVVALWIRPGRLSELLKLAEVIQQAPAALGWVWRSSELNGNGAGHA